MDIPTIPRHVSNLPKEHRHIGKILFDGWSDLVKTINGRIDFGSPQGQSVKQLGNIDGTWPGALAGGV